MMLHLFTCVRLICTINISLRINVVYNYFIIILIYIICHNIFLDRQCLYLNHFSYDTTCLASNVWKFFYNTHMFWTHLSFFLILRIIIYPLFAAASHTRWYLLNVLPFIRNDTCQILLFMSKLTVGFHNSLQYNDMFSELLSV